MIRRPPQSTRTDTLFPYTTLFRSDGDADTSILHYSLHADYEVLPGLFPLIEMNGFTTIDHANRLTGALGELDGVDLLNFGSDARDTTITIGGGLRFRLPDNVQLGLGARTPPTDSDERPFDERHHSSPVPSGGEGRNH